MVCWFLGNNLFWGAKWRVPLKLFIFFHEILSHQRKEKSARFQHFWSPKNRKFSMNLFLVLISDSELENQNLLFGNNNNNNNIWKWEMLYRGGPPKLNRDTDSTNYFPMQPWRIILNLPTIGRSVIESVYE